MGTSVLPVVRSADKATSLGLGRFLTFADLNSQQVELMGFRSASLIHLAGASRGEPGSPLRGSIVSTTQSVVSLAQECHFKRITYLSGFGVTDQSSEPYFQAKAEAENIIQSSNVPHTILRSSYILGPGDELTPCLVDELRTGKVEIPGSGHFLLQPTHVRDIVEVLVNSTNDQTTENHTINLLGKPISYKEFVELVASRIAPRAEIIHTDLETFIRRALLSRDPVFTLSELAVLVCNLTDKPTNRCLGVTIRSVTEFIDELLKSYI
jgi:uncharacterized protein YbjT (DUF2867 family)